MAGTSNSWYANSIGMAAAPSRFVAAGYWDIVRTFEPGAFDARLTSLEGKRIAQGRDFAEDEWALFRLPDDFAETRDLATEQPDVIGDLQAGRYDEAARKQLLQFFDAWGPKDPLTLDGRRRLSSILFS